MKEKSIYFISGVSGVGKTSVIPFLKKFLLVEFEVHDFDEGGVPSGADHVWRIKRTKEWIAFGKEKSVEDIILVVSGFANPDETEVIQRDFPDILIKIILLDGDAVVIEQRLRNRNNNSKVKADLERAVGNADAFIENNTRFTPILREICKKHGCSIIDTTNIDIETVAQKILENINKD